MPDFDNWLDQLGKYMIQFIFIYFYIQTQLKNETPSHLILFPCKISTKTTSSHYSFSYPSSHTPQAFFSLQKLSITQKVIKNQHCIGLMANPLIFPFFFWFILFLSIRQVSRGESGIGFEAGTKFYLVWGSVLWANSLGLFIVRSSLPWRLCRLKIFVLSEISIDGKGVLILSYFLIGIIIYIGPRLIYQYLYYRYIQWFPEEN